MNSKRSQTRTVLAIATLLAVLLSLVLQALPAAAGALAPAATNAATAQESSARSATDDAEATADSEQTSDNVIGGVNLGALTDYTLFIADGEDGFNRNDEPWLGDIVVDSQQADETGSGANQYFEGTIFVNSNNAAGTTDTGPNPGVGFMDDWVGQSAYPAQIVYGQNALVTNLETTLQNAMLAINALPTSFSVTTASSAFSSFTQTSGGLVGINSTDGINQTYVVDIDAQQISTDIVITGDPGDVYIFRWDDDHNAGNTNFANGYGGQVKFNQAALLPGGGMTAANFVHVAGDVNSSGGSGGGFYGYWLTTGSPDVNLGNGLWQGGTSSQSNFNLVGGFYTLTTQISFVSGSAGTYDGPSDYGDLPSSKYLTYIDRLATESKQVNSALLTASLGDRFWFDSNRNGLQDIGEGGIGGAIVQLKSGATVVKTAVTESSGHYYFEGVAPGTYTVQFNAPAGYTFTSQNVGANDDIDSDANASGLTGNVTLVAGQVDLSVDAGAYLTAASPDVSIGDRVWNDVNRNGLQDVGEVGVAGVTVTLRDSTGVTVLQTTTTNSRGNYSFQGMVAGTYTVGFVAPGGYSFTTANVGANDNIDSDSNVGTGITGPYTLSAGTPNVSVDAGVFLTTPPSNPLGGRLWYDANVNGIQDPGEVGIANQTVTLTNAGADNNLNTLADNIFTTTTTDANGFYGFSNAIVGRNYRVNFQPNNGWMFTNDGAGTATTDSNVVLRNNFTLNGTTGLPSGNGLVNGYEGQTASITYATTSAIQYSTDAGIFRTTALGPGHDLSANLFMGTTFATEIDAEGNGQPNSVATGDDSSNTGSADDEAAVTIPTLNPGLPATFNVQVTNTTGKTAYLYAFVDWNMDGNFSGVNETVVVQVPTATAGSVPVTFNVPSNAVLDMDLGARFRLSTSANLGPYDYYQILPIENFEAELTNVSREAPDGEVEDYLVQVESVQSIGDFVWHDLNANGLQNAGEPGIPGVTVQLMDATGTTVLATTTTDATGYYFFNVDPFPTQYVVRFIKPAGYLPSPQNVGGNDAIDSDADPVTGKTSVISVSAGIDDLTWDAGFYLPGSIGNYIWLDENSDGYQDAGEAGLPNVTVQLKNCSTGAVLATTVTDAQGGYLFANLAPGTYCVDVLEGTLPTGMFQTPYNLPGSDFGNQNHSGNGYQVVLAAEGENLTADFGYNYNPTGDVTGGTGTGAIGDHVWVDANGDGAQNPEEAGIPNVCVELVTAGPDGIFGTGDDVVAQTTTTNASGNYLFDGLTPNAYVVRMCASNFTGGGALVGYTQTGDPDHFGQPGGVNDNQTTNPVVLQPGDVFLNADFGYQPPAAQNNSIGDTVWFDANANQIGPVGTPGGTDTNEKGIPGVTVSLIKDTNNNGIWDAGEPIVATDTTDASGKYLFPGLPDGSYLVWVSDTDNVLAGKTPTYDSNGGTAPTGNGAPTGVASSTVLGLSSVINLGVGSATPVNNLLQDFGYTVVGQEPTEGLIGDRVWLDIDGDGVQDANEPGLEGIQVTLQDGSGNVLGVTTTDENGNYYFGGLPAGTYMVVVTPPSGMNQTYDADGLGTANKSTVTIGAGGINLDQDFGYRGTGTVGDLVWQDLNADGNVDAGENGIPGVTLDLYWDKNGNGTVDPGEPLVGSTVTDANGNYLFSGLPTDDGGGNAQFVVDVTDDAGVLAGYWHSLGTPNTNNNSQTDPYAVTLTPGAPNYLNADFGYYVKPACLGNFVWDDLNGNGIQDAGEPGINGVKVVLTANYASGSPYSFTTVTGDDPNQTGTQLGWYGFCNLLLDENTASSKTGTPTPTQPVYTITSATPAGYTPTLLNQGGNDMVDADNPAGVDGLTTQGQTNVDQNTGAPGSESNPNAGNDFGFESVQSLGDFVWHDLNANGQQDVGEPGIPGVTVQLMDATGTTVLATTTTDETGYYSFSVDAFPPNQYVVRFIKPAGYLPSPQNVGSDVTDSDADPVSGKTTVIQVPAGIDDLAWDAGFYLPGSIGNYVWLDENSDGYQDAGEAGLPNVTVQLKNCTTGAVLETTVTDANGGYLFDNLAPGTYCVQVDPTTLPAGMVQTPLNLSGADFGNQDQTGNGYSVVLPPEGENLTSDFGYNYNPTGDVTGGTGTAVLGDRVWIDANGDGAQDPDEVGISGVTVQLITAGPDGIFGTGDDVIAATDVTDGNGNYLFDNLPPGAYVVNIPTPPAGYTQTGDPDNFGLPCVTCDNQTTNPVVLAPGDVFLNADFGYQPPAAQNNSIGDTVWFDADADKIGPPGTPGGTDTNEYGIPGVTVALIKDSNNNGTWDPGELIIATDTTDANGNYLFPGLPDGSYIVWVNDTNNVLAGKTQTYDATAPTTDNLSSVLNLGVGSATPVANLAQDFGYTVAGQEPNEGLIGDYVWLDINGDTVQDANEPGLEGIQVTLQDGSGNVLAVTTTDENGYYYFGGLPAGTYTVVVTPPSGMTQTYDASGPLDNKSTVTIGPGGINLDQDFGYRGTGTIGDLVWQDLNADGNVDAGENGIPGVTLDLYWDKNGNGTVDPGEPLVGSTVTDGSGNYLFSGLPTDDGGGNAQFVVDVTDDAGVLAGYWHSLGTPGVNNNSQTDPYAVTLTPGAPNYLNADFGYYVKPACLGNFVWFDENSNGIQDAGEVGINGVRVVLTANYASGSPYSFTTVTGDDPNTGGTQLGWYGFCNLLLDENTASSKTGAPTPTQPVYTISVNTGQTALSGYAPTQIGQGGNAMADSNDPAGVDGLAAQGQLDVTQKTPPTSESNPIAGYDFGFAPADLGDLPDTYNTTKGSNGALHLVTSSLYLGACVDAETNGQPSATAVGDNNAASDLMLNGSSHPVTQGTCASAGNDEEGVTLVTPLVAGSQACVAVTAVNSTGSAANLYGWIDFNNNGSFDASEALTAGAGGTGGNFAAGKATINTGGVSGPNNTFCFQVPGGATFNGGQALMRFRLTTDTLGGATPWAGSAKNGEVEDYQQYLACIGNRVWDDSTKDGLQGVGESGINGVGVNLIWAGPDGIIGNGDDKTYSTTTATVSGNAGAFSFCGLTPGTYQPIVPTPPAGQPYATFFETGSGSNPFTDNNGIQPTPAGQTDGPVITLTGTTNLVTGENGPGDSTAPNNYPDNQANVSVDFGFSNTPLAVVLVAFEVNQQGSAALVSWETASELDNSGFRLYRSTTLTPPAQPFATIPSQSPGGTQGALYEYLDSAVTVGTTYNYWLEAVDLHGGATRYGPVSITIRTNQFRTFMPMVVK